jgi:DNA-binding transcriptional MerR regulator
LAKAADAFRTISEVADDLRVPKHVLRFWEGKFPQLRPMKRGGGRRFYRPEDVDLLKGIRHLLYEQGYTIKGVQKVIRDHGLDWVKACAPSTAPAAAGPAALSGNRGAKRGRPRSAAQLTTEQRKELESVLSELEGLRKLLATANS